MFGRRSKHERLQHSLVRAIQERDEAYALVEASNHSLRDAIEAYRAMQAEMQEQRAKHDTFVAQVTASLGEVAVYEGMAIGPASVLLYLNELVRDHEELERRIDLAIIKIRSEPPYETVAHEIGQILQGSVATPDQVDG